MAVTIIFFNHGCYPPVWRAVVIFSFLMDSGIVHYLVPHASASMA